MVQITKMRLPTNAEWNRLVDVVGEGDNVLHWSNMYSWCQDTDPFYPLKRMVRGRLLARYWGGRSISRRHANVGFRPAFEFSGNRSLADGTVTTADTLYMDGSPVKVPVNPTKDGDIPDYIPGAKLEFREAIDDAAYQVKAIKVGNALIADRVLLKNISWGDLHMQGIC